MAMFVELAVLVIVVVPCHMWSSQLQGNNGPPTMACAPSEAI